MARKAVSKPMKKAAPPKPSPKAPKAAKAVKAVKAVNAVKSKPPAASPKKPAAAVNADSDKAFAKFEAELRVAKQNGIDLGKRIDEVGDVGERILDEIDSIRREVEALRGGPLAAKIGRLEEAARIMQSDITAASSERKGIVKELKKAVDDIEEYSDHDDRCNAGPALEQLKEFDQKFSQMQAAVDEAKRAVESVAAGLTAKINELAAKFSMHSHFLKARNFNQDLFFHVDASGTEGSTSALPDAPRTLGVKPVRAASDQSGHEIELRLTPPRHWEDPLIWFGNVGPVDKK